MKLHWVAATLWVAFAAPACRRGTPSERAVAPPPPAADGADVSRHGAPLAGAPAVDLDALLSDPQPHAGKTIALEGPVRQACTRKGCWMELANAPKGPGVRVRFKDYGFFVPTDAAGATALAEGQVIVAEVSEEEAAHWASEGAQILRGSDGKPREVQLMATGVELRRARR